MTFRVFAIVGLLLLLALAAVGLRQCTRDASTDPGATRPDRAAARPPAGDGDEADDARVAHAAAEARAHATQDAVAAVQRYVALLGKPDKSEADAMWAGGRAPAPGSEADLRRLPVITGVRIENLRPRALDTQAPPSAFEVPVRLRVGVEAGPLRRYEGWYRVRRAITGDRWEITSARIDPSRPPG